MKPRLIKPVKVDVEVLTPMVLPGWGRLRLYGGGRVSEYNVRPILDGPNLLGCELLKDGGNSYAVDVTVYPWTCECADYEYRRRDRDAGGCKHTIGLMAYLAIVMRSAAPPGADVLSRERTDPDACTFDPAEE